MKTNRQMLKGKTLLITGGTGSFGNAVLRRLVDSDVSEVRIFSRDEKKQDDMRKKYKNELLKFYIGDVRDKSSISYAMEGVDFVFHAAALKQVPSCEFYPMEAVKTNILGTENVLDSSIEQGIQKVVCLSTDKAVYPINAMGISKAMMEKIAISKARHSGSTVICTTRYGNVMGSRGSVIPLFLQQLKEDKPFTITDPNMTRFMMTLDEAVNLVFFAFEFGMPGDIFVQKSPASTIENLATSIANIFDKNNHPIEIVGTRHGEKLFEVLLSREEVVAAEDLGDYFRIKPDFRDLNYDKYVDLGEEKITLASEYNSHNTQRLNKEAMKELLKNVDEVFHLLSDKA